MGYFNEAYIAEQRRKLTFAGCPPGDEDAYNGVCLFNRGLARSEVAQYDAWRAADAESWYRIVTTQPLFYELVAAPPNSSGDAGNIAVYNPVSRERALYGYYTYLASEVIAALSQIAASAGLAGFDWTPCQKQAMKWEWDDQVAHGRDPITIWSHSQPFSDLLYLPVKCAAERTGNAQLAAVAASMAPGTSWYAENAGLGDRRHSDRRKAALTKVLLVAALPIAGYYLTGAGAGVASSGGATVAEEAALLGIAETGGAGSTVALTGGGAVSTSLAPSAELASSAAIAEEAAALGIVQTSPGVYAAAAPAAGAAAGTSALEGAVSGVVDAAVKLGKGVVNAVAGTAAAQLAQEITGPGAQDAPPAQAQPQGGSSWLTIGGLFLVGLALARGF